MVDGTQVNIARAILAHFRADVPRSTFVEPDSHTLILWVVDGLGWALFEQALERGLLPHYRRHPGTRQRWQSVYPTTTAAGLASLAFAAPPAIHGALGYSVYVPEWDDRVNLLSGEDSRGERVPEDMVYPRVVPTLFQRLAEIGIPSAVVSPAAYRQSGFTRWLYAGATYVGYDLSHPLAAVDAVTIVLDHGHRFVWLYWPYIDQISHVAGPFSRATDQALSLWDTAYGTALHRWRTHKPALLVTADHGGAALNPRRAILRAAPHIAPLWVHRWAGERRAITTEIDPDEVRTRLEGIATVYDQQHLWNEGCYGGPPVSPTWQERTLRTLIVPPTEVQFQQDGIMEASTVQGGHGGWTDDERYIPLICKSW